MKKLIVSSNESVMDNAHISLIIFSYTVLTIWQKSRIFVSFMPELKHHSKLTMLIPAWQQTSIIKAFLSISSIAVSNHNHWILMKLKWAQLYFSTKSQKIVDVWNNF